MNIFLIYQTASSSSSACSRGPIAPSKRKQSSCSKCKILGHKASSSRCALFVGNGKSGEAVGAPKTKKAKNAKNGNNGVSPDLENGNDSGDDGDDQDDQEEQEEPFANRRDASEQISSDEDEEIAAPQVHVRDDRDDSWTDFPIKNLQDEPKILGRGMHREERDKEPNDFLPEFLGRNVGPVGEVNNLETPGQFFDQFFSRACWKSS
jgi:hypothetical protein